MSRRGQQNPCRRLARISKGRAVATPLRTTLKLDLAAHTITPTIPPRTILKLDLAKRTISAVPARRNILKFDLVKRTIQVRTEDVGQQARIVKPRAAASRYENIDIEAFYAAEYQERARCECPWQELCEECGGACEKCGTACCQTPVQSIEGMDEESKEEDESDEDVEEPAKRKFEEWTYEDVKADEEEAGIGVKTNLLMRTMMFD